MSEELKRVLEQQLWNIANTLRGKMNADEFRDYILGFIFYKYLSEKMELFADEILQVDKIKFKEITPKIAEYDEYMIAIREEALEKLGYFLKPDELFTEVAKRGRGDNQDENSFDDAKTNFIIEDLQRILTNIQLSTMGTESEDDFDNLFEDMDQDRYNEMNENLISFHKQFNYDDNDRAIVISGMSFIDDLLLNILESFFPDKSNTVDNLLSHRGALGTYGTRVDIIYCLGFIDKVIKSDLDILGQIRNKFAHKLNVSFDDKDIKQLCLKLKWHEIFMFMKAPEGATSKEIFQVGLNTIVSHLNGLPIIARSQKRKIKE